MPRSLHYLTAVSLCVFTVAAYANPHPHRGKLRPFALVEPCVPLEEDATAVSVLQQGQPYFIKASQDEERRTMIVQDIQAPVDIVWGRILDFNSYAGMVPQTVESSIYKREPLSHVQKSQQERIWVRLKMGIPMMHKKLEFNLDHIHDAERKLLRWTLDYDHLSDLDDSVGYWHVVPHPERPHNWTRAYYSAEVQMFAWVPKMVINKFIKQEKVLTDAMAWVKKFSELEAEKLANIIDHEGSYNSESCSRKPRLSNGWFDAKPADQEIPPI